MPSPDTLWESEIVQSRESAGPSPHQGRKTPFTPIEDRGLLMNRLSILALSVGAAAAVVVEILYEPTHWQTFGVVVVVSVLVRALVALLAWRKAKPGT